MLKRTAAVAMLSLVLVGCVAWDEQDDSAGGGSSQSEGPMTGLRFTYVGSAPVGTIDQTISITNPSRTHALIPTLSFEALDADDEPLPDVTVETVFGSDRGMVVAPARNEVFDILRFEGPGAREVEDVRVTVRGTREVEDAGTVYPQVEYLDARGEVLDSVYEAETVRLINAGDADFVVRLVGITWDSPAEGDSQQARTVTAVGGPVQVAGRGRVEVALSPADVNAYDSLKPFISAE